MPFCRPVSDTLSSPQHPSIRVKLVQALILLRNRGVLDPTELLSLFFGLFHCQARKAQHCCLWQQMSRCMNQFYGAGVFVGEGGWRHLDFFTFFWGCLFHRRAGRRRSPCARMKDRLRPSVLPSAHVFGFIGTHALRDSNRGVL